MKRFLLSILLILALAVPSWAIVTYNCEYLTGGAQRALDYLSVSDLNNGDRAIVVYGSGVSKYLYYFKYDASGVTAENTYIHPYYVRPNDFATAGVWYEVPPGTGSRDIYLDTSEADPSTSLQTIITAMSSGDVLHIDRDHTLSTGVTISGKTNIRITGKGSLTLSGARAKEMIFEFAGTCDNVEIDSLTLIGENTIFSGTSYYQEAVGNYSTATVTKPHIHGLQIYNINVGIDANTWTDGKIERNYISGVTGTSAGQGYGIVLSNAKRCLVDGNTIKEAGRHSIYQGSGYAANNIISNNLVLDHRKYASASAHRPAVSIARSSDVTFVNNRIYDFYDGGLGIENATGVAGVSRILVSGNAFVNRKNTLPAIYIGEQVAPIDSNIVSDIMIVGNQIHTDKALNPGGYEVEILNGNSVFVRNNTLTASGVTATARMIAVGNASYISGTTHLDWLVISGNDFQTRGTDLASSAAIEMDATTTGLKPHITITDNRFDGFGAGNVYFNLSGGTNYNLRYQNDSGGNIVGQHEHGDTTPSIRGVTYLPVNNNAATAITSFDDMVEGQITKLYFVNANTTLTASATFNLGGPASIAMSGVSSAVSGASMAQISKSGTTVYLDWQR